MEREVRIRGDMIRLGQLLKIAGLIDAGGEAASYLDSHRVLVNGEDEISEALRRLAELARG